MNFPSFEWSVSWDTCFPLAECQNSFPRDFNVAVKNDDLNVNGDEIIENLKNTTTILSYI